VDGRDRIGVPRGQGRAERRAEAGVAGNARLTAANAAVLLVPLAAEGVTILRVRQLLSPPASCWVSPAQPGGSLAGGGARRGSVASSREDNE